MKYKDITKDTCTTGCYNVPHMLLDLPGISKIEVNLANEKATLEYDESKIRLNTIEKAIEEVGYKVVYDYLIRFQRLESPNSKYR